MVGSRMTHERDGISRVEARRMGSLRARAWAGGVLVSARTEFGSADGTNLGSAVGRGTRREHGSSAIGTGSSESRPASRGRLNLCSPSGEFTPPSRQGRCLILHCAQPPTSAIRQTLELPATFIDRRHRTMHHTRSPHTLPDTITSLFGCNALSHHVPWEIEVIAFHHG